MTRGKLALLTAGALAAMGMANPEPLPAAEPETTEIARNGHILLDGNGFTVIDDVYGEEHRLDFGDTIQHVAAFLTPVQVQNGDVTSMNECGAGPLELHSHGMLQVNVQDGRFVGWYLDDRGVERSVAATLENGSGLDSPISALPGTPEIYPDSTIGHEFGLASGVYGLLSDDGPEGKVEVLWAGTNCFFR